MALLSMTGYGKSESLFEGVSCLVEVRSVNNRFLDVVCKLPKELSYFENEVKSCVKGKVLRGSINVSISLGNAESSCVPKSYNASAVEAILKMAEEMKTRYGLSGSLTVDQIFSFPNILQYDNLGEEEEALRKHLLSELDCALDKLILMRKEEGENLTRALCARIKILEQTLDEIEALEPLRIQIWKDKFLERLKNLMGDFEVDSARLLQEASIVADKLDINEEITRFRSHNKLFLAALDEGGAQGKKLNFILQEMGREANTLGTKCQNAEIQALAIRLKDEIETLREQVMNIE